jgi:hypothetical protein
VKIVATFSNGSISGFSGQRIKHNAKTIEEKRNRRFSSIGTEVNIRMVVTRRQCRNETTVDPVNVPSDGL